MNMSFESGAIGTIIAKYGWLKLFSLGAALGGALMMAAFRPPKSRKELIIQAMVALGSSFLFGDTLANLADHFFDFVNLTTDPIDKVVQFQVTVHGLVGAMSWGVFGGLKVLSDKFSASPTDTVREVKDVITK